MPFLLFVFEHILTLLGLASVLTVADAVILQDLDVTKTVTMIEEKVDASFATAEAIRPETVTKIAMTDTDEMTVTRVVAA